MKPIRLPILISSAALLLNACGDSNSTGVDFDSINVAENVGVSSSSVKSVIDNGTVADNGDAAENVTVELASSSSQTAVVQEISQPVDIADVDGEPVISFANGSVSIENDNGCVSLDGKIVTITCSGNYQLTGKSTDNQVHVQVPDSDTEGVYLYLNGLQLASATDAPIYVRNAEKVLLVLVDGTANTLEDASTRTTSFTKSNGGVDTTGAAVYAKDDLTIKGNGSLKVTGNYKNGIHSSNDLRFRDVPNVTVTSKNNALKGKGSVSIEGGYYTITSTNGDGIKSDEGEDEGSVVDGKGVVVISGGEFVINAGDDGIQAYNGIYMNGGAVKVTSKNDGLHSDLNIYIDGGETTISAGDDGIHADSTLYLRAGSVNITKAVEGMEAFYIRAEGGYTATVASDDAWNAAGGSADANTSSGSQWGGRGGFGGMMSGSKGYIIISGGYHYLYASGNDVDVLDANGTATMSGGVVILEMPSSGGMGNMRGPGGNMGGSSSCSTNMAGGLIDTDNGFTISGGVLLGFGGQTEEYPKCTATSYSAGTAYGTSNAAFKPSISGSMIVYGGDVASVSTVDVSNMKTVTLPNGMTYYEK